MKRRHLFALPAVALLFGACIPSLNPFYTEKDVVFDGRLLGEWQEKDKPNDPEVWKFESADTNSFKLTVKEKDNKTGEFNARLLKLQENYFLDLIPADCAYATNQADLVAASMFPGHLLVRVFGMEPDLKLALFDFDWLQKYLEQNPKALAHRKEGDRVILTAGTQELQRFVVAHLGDGLFSDPGTMARKSNEAPAAVSTEPAAK